MPSDSPAWFKSEAITTEDFARQFAPLHNQEIADESGGRLLIFLLQQRCAPDEYVREVADAGELGGLGARLGKSKWVINVRASLIVAAATTLDAVLTSGAANAIIALSGLQQRAIAKLNEANGELCNYLTICLTEKAGPVNSESVTRFTSGEACRYPSLHCKHNTEGVCRIAQTDVVSNLASMEKRAIIELRTDDAVSRNM